MINMIDLLELDYYQEVRADLNSSTVMQIYLRLFVRLSVRTPYRDPLAPDQPV
jgi:hypothetical protein